MKELILFVVVCFAFTHQLVSGDGKSKGQCVGEHEFWGCQSPTVECQRSCQNRQVHLERFIACAAACEMACVCEAGYFRLNNRCVVSTECPGATQDEPDVPAREEGAGQQRGQQNQREPQQQRNNNNNRGGANQQRPRRESSEERQDYDTASSNVNNDYYQE